MQSPPIAKWMKWSAGVCWKHGGGRGYTVAAGCDGVPDPNFIWRNNRQKPSGHQLWNQQLITTTNSWVVSYDFAEDRVSKEENPVWGVSPGLRKPPYAQWKEPLPSLGPAARQKFLRSGWRTPGCGELGPPWLGTKWLGFQWNHKTDRF